MPAYVTLTTGSEIVVAEPRGQVLAALRNTDPNAAVFAVLDGRGHEAERMALKIEHVARVEDAELTAT